MPLDWSSEALAAGLACYRKQQFFEAHEHWEDAWNQLADPEKLFLQALIQITVAMHHFQNGNYAGMFSLLKRALLKLERYPERFGGIDVTCLRDDVRAWIGAEESALPLPFPFIRVVEC